MPMNQYQGFAIVFNYEGNSIKIYKPSEKQEFDQDIKEGYLSDGSFIAEQKWLDRPSNENSLINRAEELYESLFEAYQ